MTLHVDRCLLALAFVSLLAPPASGLESWDCAKAAMSNDGRFLVISDTQYAPVKGDSNLRRVTQITYRIFPPLDLAHQGYGDFNHPGNVTHQGYPMAFWQDSVLWTVTLDQSKAGGCPLPLFSGEYLVLLTEQQGFFPRGIVMRIYRSPTGLGERHRGVLVKELTLEDLWSGHKFTDEEMAITNGTPLWFAGASFQWGRDNLSLIYKVNDSVAFAWTDHQPFAHPIGWKGTVRIDMITGSVSACPTLNQPFACTTW